MLQLTEAKYKILPKDPDVPLGLQSLSPAPHMPHKVQHRTIALLHSLPSLEKRTKYVGFKPWILALAYHVALLYFLLYLLTSSHNKLPFWPRKLCTKLRFGSIFKQERPSNLENAYASFGHTSTCCLQKLCNTNVLRCLGNQTRKSKARNVHPAAAAPPFEQRRPGLGEFVQLRLGSIFKQGHLTWKMDPLPLGALRPDA